MTIIFKYDGNMGLYLESMSWGREVLAHTAPATPTCDRHPGPKGHITPEGYMHSYLWFRMPLGSQARDNRALEPRRL